MFFALSLSLSSLSYALAASAPHTHRLASFAPCAIAGSTYAAPRHDGPNGTNHDGLGVPADNASAATNTCADVATRASAMGNPRSALEIALGVNRGRISSTPNANPRLNSASTSTERSTNFSDVSDVLDDVFDDVFDASTSSRDASSDDDARRAIDDDRFPR